MNDDDLDDENIELSEDNFDAFEDKQNTLGDVLRNNAMAKIGVIAGAIIAIFGAIILFGGESGGPTSPSYVGTSSDVSAPPGTDAASPVYIDQIQEENERNVEIAQQTGGSALPTPIEPPVGVLTAPEQEQEEEDPLLRWRRLQEERLQKELQQAQPVAPAPAVEIDTSRGEAVSALADLMAQQMQAILDSQENTISSVTLTSTEEFLNRQAEEAEEQIAQLQDDAFNDPDLNEEDIEETLLSAGEIEYAQLLIEANTDAPGPILAQIVSGPLKGSRVIGSFETQRNFLTLTFNSVIIDGEAIGIDAIALDPKTTLPGLITDIDRRYFQRVLLPAAAAFIEGAAEAISESGLTTVTIEGETVAEETQETDNEQEIAAGVEEAAEELSDILDEAADVDPLLRVEAGTPMGILFLESVVR